jgi:hypothetical protein
LKLVQSQFEPSQQFSPTYFLVAVSLEAIKFFDRGTVRQSQPLQTSSAARHVTMSTTIPIKKVRSLICRVTIDCAFRNYVVNIEASFSQTKAVEIMQRYSCGLLADARRKKEKTKMREKSVA